MRVLLIDDTESIRQTIAMILSFDEIACEVVEDVPQAFQILRNSTERGQRFDVVISDLLLPSGMAADLFTYLNLIPTSQRPTSVLCSASDQALMESQNFGADHFLPKPFTIDALLGLLAQIAAKRGIKTRESDRTVSVHEASWAM